ncbi:MAG: methyltransferase [Bacteroidota bacterium]
MPNQTFVFKQFVIHQDKCAMKVGTDAVLLGAWADPKGAKNILDIGTGTGIIALMLAQRSGALIDALDIDENACLQARENVSNCPWKERINVIHSSAQDYSLRSAKKYDLIISNPPYFEASTKALEQKRTVARHNDMLPYCELLASVLNLLDSKGKFYVILPCKEGEHLRDMAAEKKLYLSKITRVRTRTDKTTEKRLLMQFSFEQKHFSEDSIVIEKDARHDYTDEYKQLTRDYYLAF